MTTTKSKKTTTTKKKSAPTPIPELAANPFAFEVLELASKQRTIAKKVEVLEKYKDPSLTAIFIWNYDTALISALPEGDVPYAGTDEQGSFSMTLGQKIQDAVAKMNELGSKSLGSQDQGHSSIRKEYTKFYNFLRGGNDSLSNLRRETMFINIVSGLHPLEAEIVLLCKDKKLQTRYKLDKKHIAKAYPEIKWRDGFTL
jgi:hypothetical protein|tara:strand:- start:880 stop:1479 length:600 start_codon:yes stop_codon:yes gene_type:complete